MKNTITVNKKAKYVDHKMYLNHQNHLSQNSQLALWLQNHAPDLYSRANHIYSIACKEIYPNLTLPEFTDHGKRHIDSVLKLADELLFIDKIRGRIPIEYRLKEGETFLLLVSILLHDIGQLDHDFTYRDSIETFKKHGENSEKLILEYEEKFNLEPLEAKVISKICRSHCVREYKQEFKKEWSIDTTGPCRLHIIMALLRIADLLDLTYARAPSFILGIKRFRRDSQKHWERHSIISDVVVDAAKWTITVYAEPKSIKQCDEIEKFCSWLNEELRNVKNDFKELGLYFAKTDLELDTSNFSKPVLPTPSSNPFIGLRPFQSSNADFFFGREDVIEQIIELCKIHKFLSLVGESGVGKTSLVNAGVIPMLRSIRDKYATYRFASSGLRMIWSTICEAMNLPVDSSWEELMSSFNKLKKKNKDFYLYIDQFEELFTLSFNQSEKEEFKNLLSELLLKIESFKVIISIRSEFLIDLWEMGKKNRFFFTPDNIYRVSKLSPEKAEECMEKPLRKFSNLAWSEGIIQRLSTDLSDHGPTVYPPYLQLVCQKLVEQKLKIIECMPEYEWKNQHVIDLEMYEKLGGAEEIIKVYFQTVLDDFSPKEREVIDEILVRMITEFNSRKPIRVEEVNEINKGRIDVKWALQKLIDSRVVKRVYFGYELEHDLLARKLITLLRSDVKASTKIREVIDFMKSKKHRRVTLAKLSMIASLSKSQLIRRFSAETSMTPLDYLQKLRIDESKRLLRDTSDSAKIIAKRCGFKTPSHFINIFKRFVNGKTPLEYRKMIKETHAKEFDIK